MARGFSAEILVFPRNDTLGSFTQILDAPIRSAFTERTNQMGCTHTHRFFCFFYVQQVGMLLCFAWEMSATVSAPQNIDVQTFIKVVGV